jgi:hypothetical protein
MHLLKVVQRINSEAIPQKKYRLRSFTKRALSASLPFSEFFITVFLHYIIAHLSMLVNDFSNFYRE